MILVCVPALRDLVASRSVYASRDELREEWEHLVGR
jgi:hypothetical protein